MMKLNLTYQGENESYKMYNINGELPVQQV